MAYGISQLENRDWTFKGSVTIEGNFTFGNAATDTLTVNGVLNVGADDTGYDVNFYGATSGKKVFWDESADTLYLTCTNDIDGTVTVGVDDTGYDVKFFSATSGKYWLWDESADEMLVYGTSYFDGKIKLGLNGGAASASGVLMGVGTSANPAATSSANSMFAEFRTRCSATSGDSRGLYWRHELTGAGVSGETIRAFTKVSAAVATARGAHISLDVNTTGSISGLGCGVDAQLYVPNQAIGGGTFGVVNSEIYSDGASSSITGSTTAFFRAVAGGNATGAATVDTSGYLFSIQGLTMASGKLFQANTAADATHALRILIGGTPYYIMLTNVGA